MSKVTEQTVKIKVTKHPREMFYEGRSTRDHMIGLMEFLNKDPVIPDAKLVAKFLKTVKADDIVGVEHNQYRVVKVTKESLLGTEIKSNRETELSLTELTTAVGSGFAEILYRKGKPYGIELEKEVKVKIVNHTKEEEKESATSELGEDSSSLLKHI